MLVSNVNTGGDFGVVCEGDSDCDDFDDDDDDDDVVNENGGCSVVVGVGIGLDSCGPVSDSAASTDSARSSICSNTGVLWSQCIWESTSRSSRVCRETRSTSVTFKRRCNCKIFNAHCSFWDGGGVVVVLTPTPFLWMALVLDRTVASGASLHLVNPATQKSGRV